jgi:hypothetical protein
MNTQYSGDPASLPELTPARVDEIEDALFAAIAREGAERRRRQARRGRLWIAGGAAAAVVAVAAIIAPSVGSLVGGGAGGGSAVAPAEGLDSGVTLESPAAPDDARSLSGGASSAESQATDTAARDIITTATASMTVDDVEAAARSIGDAAESHGGYVESMTIDRHGTAQPAGPGTGASDDVMPSPSPLQGSTVTVRVPSEDLTTLVTEVSALGEVTSSAINRQDVTEQTVDLQARIDAAQASVDRLTALMAEAQNVGDLIAAESALSERQALLESYQQQLKMLDGQVEMSTLTVFLAPRVEQVTADPAGFGDGFLAGWNGLVATLNAVVVALGFLVPWLAVGAVAALLVWSIVRLARRRRRSARADAGAPSSKS